MSITLVTGPARSGKSEWAELLAQKIAVQKDRRPVYVATARRDPDDVEWQARIDKHVQRRLSAEASRPAMSWQCIEVPVDLPGAIAQYTASDCLLVDSLGTWLANLIEQTDEQWQTSQSELIAVLQQTQATIVLVAEETGWGMVPAYKMGRTFRDRLGSLSRCVGELSVDTYLVTCGYAINLAKMGQPVGGCSVDREERDRSNKDSKSRDS